MSIEAARARAESRMITPCRVLRPTGKVFDPETNVEATTAQLVLTDRCELTAPDTQVTFAESAEAVVASQQALIKLPVRVGPVLPGDLIQTLTPAGAPARTFWVAASRAKTWQSCQRLPVQEIATDPITVV